ncbi:MAG: hypothetical protein V7723_11935 [Sneathiella sp.]|uniref:hypothetical protein n=1 Tax=Sneathiella sp. TaxID=1964365 RepID=UPI003001F5AF
MKKEVATPKEARSELLGGLHASSGTKGACTAGLGHRAALLPPVQSAVIVDISRHIPL